MFNPAVKKIIPGAGVAVLACVAIALFVTWSAQKNPVQLDRTELSPRVFARGRAMTLTSKSLRRIRVRPRHC